MPEILGSTSKRKPATILQSSSPKRRYHSNTPSRPSSIPTTTKPEPFSINATLRQYDRTRLYVPPLHWTLHHLKLLGCRYVFQDHNSGTELDSALTSECCATPPPRPGQKSRQIRLFEQQIVY
ncbi:hypothetical protein FQN54_004319 [Arachnomyces sp. PD_36]|nr:hypothetical protein FQN54_004319 [Arachnomyces sp. PD_36]